MATIDTDLLIYLKKLINNSYFFTNSHFCYVYLK